MTIAAVQKPTNGQATPAPKRMTLKSLVRGRQSEPQRVLIYGPEGCGKSTFGAASPSPIFLAPESGTAQLDVVRFPTPQTWPDMLEAVRTLTEDEHEFKTLVVDTLDHAEPLLWKWVCEQAGVKSIEDVGGGYGKGYVAALDGWRTFLAAIERMRRDRQMNIVFVAHSMIKAFKSPEGSDWERYQLKINEKAAGLFKEWVDEVLFANYETLTVKDSATKRVKGVSTGARLIYTTRTAAYDAKNRHDLPESLPLAWADFAEAVEAHKPADVGALKGEIERKAKLLGGELETKTIAAIERAGDDAAKLAKLNDWANGKLSERS